MHRAHGFPLPDSPGQVKLPVGQEDLNKFFFFILYKQVAEFQNSWSRASDDFEKRRALILSCTCLANMMIVAGGRFKNTDELLNLRALKFSPACE